MLVWNYSTNILLLISIGELSMTSEEMAEEARRLFDLGFHCSQAVFSVGMKRLGWESPDVVAALSPLGGGLGCTGDVCGSLPGALAVLGLVMGKRNPEEKDHRLMWKLAHRMATSFDEITEQYGGRKCYNIVGIDWKDRKQARSQGPGRRRQECLEVVGETARALGRLLDKIDQGKTGG